MASHFFGAGAGLFGLWTEELRYWQEKQGAGPGFARFPAEKSYPVPNPLLQVIPIR